MRSGRTAPFRLQIALVLCLLSALATASEPAAAGSGDSSAGRRKHRACRGVKVRAGASLQRALRRAGRGATLCLEAATYRTATGIAPRRGQKLVGVSRSKTTIKTGKAPAVIDIGDNANVTIKKLSVTGAVGRPSCSPRCGRGIVPGYRTSIVRVRIHHNDALGIGGGGGGLVVRRSEIDHNGRPDLYGCCAGGIKSASAYTIRKTYVHDNVGVGIWCDVGCRGGRWIVSANTSIRNTLGGIRYEISGVSGSAVIKNNMVRGNNKRRAGGHGGIEINSSRNVVVEHNRVRGNVGPGVIVNGRRRPGLANISVRHNRLTNDEIRGCGGPVTCLGNG